jgi:tetratricopeptide (TPR) repeat protein
LAEQHQFTYLAALAPATLGDVRSRLGRVAEGVELIRRGIAGMLEIGARLHISAFTASLAAALERKGSIVEALETVEQALRVNPDELVYQPEILQTRGELRLKLGERERAETDFREAMALAQKIGARSYELRAAMSLTRLLALQGHRNEASETVAAIYNRFTEGFDTADLKDAKALLDQLTA